MGCHLRLWMFAILLLSVNRLAWANNLIDIKEQPHWYAALGGWRFS
ncbi:MAG: hypothetical protein WBV88_01180 [Candidatus Rickettsiella isopodorum]|nr:hypothetical protein [Gammaproteobacteria bacterium]MDD5161892.1 hypothetical protein [Candidatus Rickettsiella isopodorum]